MDELLELERQIQNRLATARERGLAEQATIRLDMEVHEQRTAGFAAVAKRLMQTVVRPRVHKLASLFPNSHLTDLDQSTGYGIVCKFDHTPEYPAGTELDLGVSADSGIENAILTYDLKILPIFFQFKGHDQTVVPCSSVDDGPVATWVDSKLLDFTDTYLQLQVVDQYQRENIVVDPVCGMRINRTNAAATYEHNGKTHYFCAEQCQRKFADDPERYATRRSK